jgi:hypothetical protein
MLQNKNELGYTECQKVVELNKKIQSTFLIMAEKMKAIRDGKLYIGGGHETFWQFCEEDLGMSESTASKLITSYEVLILKYKISHEKVLQNGWTNCYRIACASETKEQAEELLDKNLPPSELTKELADKNGGGECRHEWKEIHLRQCSKCMSKEKIFDK